MRSATFLSSPPHSSKISQYTADVFLELHQTACSLLSVVTYYVYTALCNRAWHITQYHILLSQLILAFNVS